MVPVSPVDSVADGDADGRHRSRMDRWRDLCKGGKGAVVVVAIMASTNHQVTRFVDRPGQNRHRDRGQGREIRLGIYMHRYLVSQSVTVTK